MGTYARAWVMGKLRAEGEGTPPFELELLQRLAAVCVRLFVHFREGTTTPARRQAVQAAAIQTRRRSVVVTDEGKCWSTFAVHRLLRSLEGRPSMTKATQQQFPHD